MAERKHSKKPHKPLTPEQQKRKRARRLFREATHPLTPAQREARRLYNAAYHATHQKQRKPLAPEQQEARRLYMAAYHVAHREEILVAKVAYYYAHREEDLARSAAWRAAHAEEHRASAAAWNAAHPEARAVMANRRRAMKAGAPINDFTAAQWTELQAACDHRCSYCGKRAKGHLTQDHITPLSQGGSHTLSNIVPACRSCNSKKHTGPALVPTQPMLLTLAPSKRKEAA